jgi:hypothetical protein
MLGGFFKGDNLITLGCGGCGLGQCGDPHTRLGCSIFGRGDQVRLVPRYICITHEVAERVTSLYFPDQHWCNVE